MAIGLKAVVDTPGENEALRDRDSVSISEEGNTKSLTLNKNSKNCHTPREVHPHKESFGR
jgi:hypothetical protein